MDYWQGVMNWPLDPGWACEICGTKPGEGVLRYISPGLTWGLQHGVCRCDVCHTEYTLRDWQTEGHPRVTTPICCLKPEYKIAFIELWAKYHCPVDEVTDQDWKAALEQQEV